MITAFTAVMFVIIYFVFFSIIKSAFKTGTKISSVIIKYGKYLA